MQNLILFILVLVFISCQHKSDKKIVESDESQILNLALDNVVGSDTTFRFLLRRNPPPIPIIAFTDKIDSVEYLKYIHWRDSIIKILDTASLFVVAFKKHEYIVDYNVRNLLDTIKQKKSDTLFNGVLKILCDQNLSNDTANLTLLKTKYNFKIYNSDIAPDDPLRKIGSIHFSKIAFNKQKDTACVHTRFLCGEFCSKGDIHFFLKKGDKWVYSKKIILWSS